MHGDSSFKKKLALIEINQDDFDAVLHIIETDILQNEEDYNWKWIA